MKVGFTKLGIAPCFDDATAYTFKWFQQEMAAVRPDVELVKERAVRLEVEEVLRSLRSPFVIFYDHGTEGELIGNDSKAVLDSGNVGLLAGAELYSLACLSAKGLGVLAYRTGCLAYWGFVQTWGFTVDEFEAGFKEVAAWGLFARLRGLSWAQSKDETRARYSYWLDKATVAGAFWAAAMFRSDRDALRCWALGVDEPPKEACPVSRAIVALFGYSVLWRLRRLRSFFFGR